MKIDMGIRGLEFGSGVTIFNGIIVPEGRCLSSLRSSSDVSFLSDITSRSSPSGICVAGVGLFKDL